MKTSSIIASLIILLILGCGETPKDKLSEQEIRAQEQAEAMHQAMIEASKKYIAMWNDNNLDSLVAITAENVIRNANGEETSKNQTELAETMKFWHTAMPDFTITAKEIVFKGNKTYVTWDYSGTNTGMFGELPPTNKKSTGVGITILTFDDIGKIIHEEAHYNVWNTLSQWGYTIVPPISEIDLK